MGMNFSPMYQPVSTKTIKADGDLNINPYDLLATDVKCDTVEATEFVGGVGNFTNIYANNVSKNTIPLYKIVLSSSPVDIIDMGTTTSINNNQNNIIKTVNVSPNTTYNLLLYMSDLHGCIGDIDPNSLQFVLYKYGGTSVRVYNNTIDLSVPNDGITLSYTDFKSIVNEQTYVSTGTYGGSTTTFGFGVKNISGANSYVRFTTI